MAYEAYWDDCTLALRLDGADGSTTITDDKGHTVTVVGNAALDTDQSKSGGASLYLDANTTNYPRLEVASSADFNDLGTGDFTIECWFRLQGSTTPVRGLLSCDVGDLAFKLYARFGSVMFEAGQGAEIYLESAGGAPVDTWNHAAVSRVSGTTRLFVNGVQEADTTSVGTVTAAGSKLRVGANADTTGLFFGHIDEVYIVKGVGLYTANFTPVVPTFAAPATTGPSTLPIVVSVQASGVSSLPITVSVGQSGSSSMGIEVAVVDADYLSGATLASDGGTEAGAWSPVVVIGGVDRTDDIVGDIDIDAGRGAARIASFALKASGVINPTALVGQRVSIDIATAAGGNRMRLFSGRINEPRLDMVGKTVAITCTDDLQNVINGMPRAALDALIGGHWSPAVFDKGASSWVYAQDRLSTVAASLDLSPWGAARVTPWAAGSVDLTFDGDTVLGQSVEVSLAARAGLVNEIAVDFGYRFPMAKREGFPVHFEYLTNGFGPWVDAGNAFLSRSAVVGGIEAAGGAIQNIEFVALPTNSILINTGGGGVAPWIPNPATDPLYCLGFEALVTFDYTQDIDELHKITVRSPASVAAMGALRQTLSGSLRGETVDTLAAETNAHLWGLGLSNIPPVDAPAVVPGQTSAEAMVLTADTNRAAAEAALATLVEVAKVKIIASHMDTTVSAAVPLHPLIDLDKTITIDDQGVLATGRVSRVRHSMSPSESARAVTEFEISLCRLSGIGIPDVETPTAPPAGVEDGPTGPLAPVVCTFNGLLGQDQSFEITFPAVEASQREAAEVVIDSAFDVALVEDVLTIDMGA